jgi:hypothetical protein
VPGFPPPIGYNTGMKRPQFSLRLLLVLIALISLLMIWAVYQRNWIRQRHAYLKEQLSKGFGEEAAGWQHAPWPLGWFGEQGMFMVTIPNSDPDTIKRAHDLFPEVSVWINGSPTSVNGPPIKYIWNKSSDTPLFVLLSLTTTTVILVACAFYWRSKRRM